MSVTTVRFFIVLSMFFGVAALGVISGLVWPMSPSLALAQEECPFNSCDFICDDEIEHEWNDDDIDGIWIIVDAVPVEDMSGDARWYDTGDTSWAPMKVEGTWENATAGEITSYVEVDDDGECTYEDTKGEYIICHDFISSTTLCDGYGGNWARETAGAEYCVDHYEYGFDFRKEVLIGIYSYCFQEAEVTSQAPGPTGIRGRTVSGSGGCGTPLDWDEGETVPTTQCYEIDESRPGGSDVVRMEIRYSYTAH
jgi:hypothetical protein